MLCVDEEIADLRRLTERSHLLPIRARRQEAERRSHDYQRHGTTSLFAALDVKKVGL